MLTLFVLCCFLPLVLPNEYAVYPHAQKNVSAPQISVLHTNSSVACVHDLNLMPGDRLTLIADTGKEMLVSKQENAHYSYKGDHLYVKYTPSLMTVILPMNIPPSQRDPIARIYFFAEDSNESILGNIMDYTPAICFKERDPEMYNASRAVGQIRVKRIPSEPGNASIVSCTGSIIGPGNFILTNYHCVFQELESVTKNESSVNLSVTLTNEELTCSQQQNLRQTAMERTNASQSALLETNARIVAYNATLDYCLLKLKSSTLLNKDYKSLQLRKSGMREGEKIYIPQHPQGLPKVIVTSESGVPSRIWSSSKAQSGYANQHCPYCVLYNADTEPGSSGSPIIATKDDNIIALHHAGAGIGQPNVNDNCAKGECNEGIRIDAIIKDLEEKNAMPPKAVGESCM